MSNTRPYSRSSSLVIGLSISSVMIIAAVVAGYFLLLANDRVLTTETDAALLAEVGHIKTIDQFGGRSQIDAYIKAQNQTDDPLGFVYQFDDMGPSQWQLSRPQDSSSPYQVIIDGETFLAERLRLNNGDSLVVARSLREIGSLEWAARSFGFVLLILFLLFAFLAIGIGFYVVRAINRIGAKAAIIIETGNLSERLPVDSDWDDLSHLTKTLNRLLEELESRVEAVATVSDNIAHDLRTPIMRLQTHLEALPDSDDKTTLLQEVEQILSIFTGLLRIARVENDRRKLGFQRLDLGSLLDDVCSFYEAVAEDRGQTLSAQIAAGLMITGDRDMLFQTFSNIVDNALKFSPDDGQISISAFHVASANPRVTIMIDDAGPGIPATCRTDVFKRFNRLDQSRSTPGYGLGLTFVAAVTALHDATVQLDTSPLGGLRVVIKLPANPLVA